MVDVLTIGLIGGGFLIAIFIVAKTNMKKGDMMGWLWRRYPKYENLDKNTLGRVAGATGITKKEGGFVDIRYKTGIFSSEIDRDIPTDFIKPIDPPETPIKEGILRVYPYTIGKPTYYRIWDLYKDLISLYEANFTLMNAHLKNVKDMLATKIDKRLLVSQLDNLTTVLGKLMDNLKAKKAEVTTYAIESPAEARAQAPKEAKKP